LRIIGFGVERLIGIPAVLGMLMVAFSEKHFHEDKSSVLTDATEASRITGPKPLKMKT